jgi:F420-non-reducing hydrogenase small subunit
MEKPKIAFTWTSSCGGCEESLLDLGPDLLSLTREAEIIYWPIALDFKKERLDRLGDGALLASWINGAIRLDEHEETVRLLRRKSQIIVAHGTCAHLGGVAGLANLFTPEEILNGRGAEYFRTPIQEDAPPHEGPALPLFTSRVKTLDQVITVDYTIPGCPPTPEWNRRALAAILENRLPPPGWVFGESKALCHFCARKESRPVKVAWDQVSRLHQKTWDPDRCFLAEGLICLGPATRGGCAGRCLSANMPCRGCFGPPDLVKDQGTKVVSFLAALSEASDEEALKKFSESWIDPVGLAYLYSLPAALIPRKVKERLHG